MSVGITISFIYSIFAIIWNELHETPKNQLWVKMSSLAITQEN